MAKRKTQKATGDRMRDSIFSQGPIAQPFIFGFQVIAPDDDRDVWAVGWEDIDGVPLLVGDLVTIAAFDNPDMAVAAAKVRGGIAYKWFLRDLIARCEQLNMRAFLIPLTGDGYYLRKQAPKWGVDPTAEDDVPF